MRQLPVDGRWVASNERRAITLEEGIPEFAFESIVHPATAGNIVITFWRLTDEERAAITEGCDIMLALSLAEGEEQPYTRVVVHDPEDGSIVK